MLTTLLMTLLRKLIALACLMTMILMALMIATVVTMALIMEDPTTALTRLIAVSRSSVLPRLSARLNDWRRFNRRSYLRAREQAAISGAWLAEAVQRANPMESTRPQQREYERVRV